MLKRNDLCHCGSGKKYKKCCIEKDMKNRVFDLNEKALEVKKEKIDTKYTNAIVKLSHKLEELIDNNETFSSMEENARNDLFDDMVINNIAANRFFASYFSYDYGSDKDETPAIYVLNHNKFSEEERKIIYSCVYSYPSLFVIEDISGIRVRIKDVFSGKVYNTLDSKILSGFEVGNYLLGRPVKIDDIYILIDLTIRIQEETKTFIYDIITSSYNSHYSAFRDIDDFVSINSLFFYKNMLQLLQISDYKDKNLEESIHDLEDEDDEEELELEEHILEDKKELKRLLNENIKEEDIKSGIVKLWLKISEKISITGSENGWAAGFEYNYRKSIGQSVTQESIAKIYGVSISTLAKRNKEISTLINDIGR